MNAYEENKAAEIDTCYTNIMSVLANDLVDFLWENWETIEEENLYEFEDIMKFYLSGGREVRA